MVKVSNTTQVVMSFVDVATLTADASLTYANTLVGSILEAGGFRYEVAASGASDHHLTTAGGVKLYVLPGENGYNVLSFGAATSATAQIAANVANGTGIPVFFPKATYAFTTTVTIAAPDNLHFVGEPGAVIDFSTGSGGVFKLGDFTIDGSGYFTQTSFVGGNISFRGLDFTPSSSGWDGSVYAHINPIMLSALEHVEIENCKFSDHHVAAIDMAARCRDVLVRRCQFSSTFECDTIYGVRPFLYNGPLLPYDGVTGQLTSSAPTVSHENITVTECDFYQLGRGIVSWNVHGSKYTFNTFRKPTIRSISVTNWNFDSLIFGNRHVIEDNSVETLSTCINIGIGSERVVVENEIFEGTVSGTGINANCKVILVGNVTRDIVVRGNRFAANGVQQHVYGDRNSSAKISDNQFIGATITSSPISIVSGDGSTTFNQELYEIINNKFVSNVNRAVILNSENAGGTGIVRVKNNVFSELLPLGNGVVVFAADALNWIIDLGGNDLVRGNYAYITNNGGAYTLLGYDDGQHGFVQHDTGAATTIAFNWREHHGDVWFIVPNSGVGLTVTDITGELFTGHQLTIIGGGAGGGSVTLPQGNFRNKGSVNAVLASNQCITYVNRAGLWFETGRGF